MGGGHPYNPPLTRVYMDEVRHITLIVFLLLQWNLDFGLVRKAFGGNRMVAEKGEQSDVYRWNNGHKTDYMPLSLLLLPYAGDSGDLMYNKYGNGCRKF